MHQRHIPWASSLSSSSYHHLHHVHHHPHHHLFGDVVHQRPSVLTIRRTIHLSLWLFSVHQFCFFLSLQLAQYLATQVALDPTPVIKSLSWTELRTSFKASLQACCSLLCCYVYLLLCTTGTFLLFHVLLPQPMRTFFYCVLCVVHLTLKWNGKLNS